MTDTARNGLPRIYGIWASISLVHFLVTLVFQVLASVSAWPVLPLAIFALGILVFPGQLLVIMALNGDRLVPEKRSRSTRARQRALYREGLRVIPPGPRWLGLAYTHAYFPLLLAWVTAGSKFELFGAAMFAGLGAFSLIHFLALRFVVPRRQEIIERVDSAE